MGVQALNKKSFRVSYNEVFYVNCYDRVTPFYLINKIQIKKQVLKITHGGFMEKVYYPDYYLYPPSEFEDLAEDEETNNQKEMEEEDEGSNN